MQTCVEHRGECLRCVIAGKIGAADVSDKQRVAGEDGARSRKVGKRIEVRHRNTDALDRMAGSPHEIEPAFAELQRIAILDGRVRKRRVGVGTQVNSSAGAFRQFAMTRNEVGVQVRFDDVLDLQALLRGGFHVDVDVALRIDHGRDSLRTDQIRSVRQATQKEVLDQNRFHVSVPNSISNQSR